MAFESNRLIFREYEKTDFPLFYQVFSDERVMRYAYMNVCSSEPEILPYFHQILANNSLGENERKAYEYAVFSREDGAYVGFADIVLEHKNTDGGVAEIGYFLLPSCWGAGYATEMAQTLLNFCFMHLHLHRVCASCNRANASSEKIMQKIGMLKEGEFRKARYKNGKWEDELRYAILAEEWKRYPSTGSCAPQTRKLK